MRAIFCVFLTALISAEARAEVVKSSENGFIIEHNIIVSQSTTRVFPEMTGRLGAWWNPDHSFSGNSTALRVDAECFCERWGANLVHHLDTTIWIENEKVVMQGGLGPLKELGLSGSMTWSLAPSGDAGTVVAWKYHVFGYSEADLPGLAVAVDGVLKEQINRLAGHLGNTGDNATSK